MIDIDMLPAFIRGIGECFPNAKITFDKIHSVKHASEGIDEQRQKIATDLKRRQAADEALSERLAGTRAVSTIHTVIFLIAGRGGMPVRGDGPAFFSVARGRGR